MPSGYGPADLQSAYQLAAASGADGSGQTVAIVDAYDDPNAEADLGVYRSTFALPPCTTANGCFLKVNEQGQTAPLPPTDGSGLWEEEESLDLDMVSAICPKCEILLVEADSAGLGYLFSSESTAGTCGATEISNSWGGPDGTDMPGSPFDQPGVMITASSGDSGYPNSGLPATSPYVTAVGGTILQRSGSTWTETVWPRSGSACSTANAQPAWQTALGLAYTSVCSMRIANDVAAVAEGVAAYDTFGRSGGWRVFGGTSVSSPVVAAIYALAGNGRSLNFASNVYAHASSLFDVTSGSNGSCSGSFLCNARPGFDGPSGNGAPRGLGAF